MNDLHMYSLSRILLYQGKHTAFGMAGRRPSAQGTLGGVAGMIAVASGRSCARHHGLGECPVGGFLAWHADRGRGGRPVSCWMRPGVVNRRAVWLAVLALSAMLAILFCAVWVFPRLLDPPLSMAALRDVASAQARIQLQQAQAQLANNARSAILQGLAGLVLVTGAVATWWQVHIGRQGQITDRYSKAVDQLASRSVVARIGSIYAMERIARNSAADRDAILFLLGAFVRIHSPWPVGAPDGPRHPTAAVDENLPWMRVRAPDIQAAMGALGRLPRSREEPTISLSRVDLRSVALRDSRLNGSRFRYANMARSVLGGVWLENADLTGADLRLVSLDHAHLAGLTSAGPRCRAPTCATQTCAMPTFAAQTWMAPS